MGRDEFVEGSEALDRPAHAETVLLTHDTSVERLDRLLGEALVNDERLGLGVVDDVVDLRADEMPVDGGHVQAALVGGQAERELLEAVGQQGRDLIALAEPGGPQTPGDPVGEGGQLAEGQLAVLGVDHRREVGISLSDIP